MQHSWRAGAFRRQRRLLWRTRPRLLQQQRWKQRPNSYDFICHRQTLPATCAPDTRHKNSPEAARSRLQRRTTSLVPLITMTVAQAQSVLGGSTRVPPDRDHCSGSTEQSGNTTCTAVIQEFVELGGNPLRTLSNQARRQTRSYQLHHTNHKIRAPMPFSHTTGHMVGGGLRVSIMLSRLHGAS